MPLLAKSHINHLLRGSSLLACGGGLAFEQQQQLLAQPKLQKKFSRGVEVVSPSQLSPTAVCATVAEVGAAGAPVMDKAKLAAAVRLLEHQTGQQIRAIIPGEIGQEAITIEAAGEIGLPIVDADLAGCRAVPRLTDLSLVVQGVPFTMSPMVVLLQSGELQFVPQQASLAADEKIIRSLVPAGQVVTMVGGLITAATIVQHLHFQSYTVAQQVGQALADHQPLQLVLPTSILFGPEQCTVTALTEQPNNGFTDLNVQLSNGTQQLSLQVENEYLQLQVGAEQWRFPQLIMVFDQQLGRGIHSSQLHVGANVTVVVAEAFPFWQQKKVRSNI